MGDTNYEVLQGIAQRNYGLDLPGALRVATGNAQDLEGIAKSLYSEHSNKHFEELKTVLGGRSANFTGTNGVYWETSDKAALDIIGDIDIRAEVEDVQGASNRTIISKYTPTTQQSYEWRYNGFGFDELVWSTTGANAITDTLGISGRRAVRVTMDVVNGTDRVLSWYYSDSDEIDGSWTHRSGSPKTVAGTTSIFASTAVCRIGARSDAAGANPFNGKIRRVELRNLIDGTVVANPDFRYVAPGAASFVDSAGNTWTAVGGATTV